MRLLKYHLLLYAAVCGVCLFCSTNAASSKISKLPPTVPKKISTTGQTLLVSKALPGANHTISTTVNQKHSQHNQTTGKLTSGTPSSPPLTTSISTNGTNANKPKNATDTGKTDLTSGIANVLGGNNMANLQNLFGNLGSKQLAELLHHNSALQYHKDKGVTKDLEMLDAMRTILGNDTDISVTDLQKLQKLMKNKQVISLLPKVLGILDSETFQNLLPKVAPLLDSLGDLSDMLGQVIPLVGGLLEKKIQSIAGPYEISKNCTGSLSNFIKGVVDGKEASLQMLDAAGKPTTSLLKGNVVWIGNYDECQEYGSYCALSIDPPSFMKKRLNVKVPTGKIDLRIDLCVPHACNETELQRLVQHVLHIVELQLDEVKCLEPRGLIKEDDNAIIALCILGFICVLTAGGVFFDLLKTQPNKPKASYRIDPIDAYDHIAYGLNGTDRIMKKAYPAIPMNEINSNGEDNSGYDGGEITKRNGSITKGIDDIEDMPESIDMGSSGMLNTDNEDEDISLFHRLVLSFSLKRNLQKILKTKPREEMLSCLDGIRVLSMGYLMLAFIFTTYTPDQLANGLNMLESKRKFLLQAIINGTLSTDTFFLLSGTVVSYLFLKETKKRGGIKITQMIYYYIHRIWRLTPLYGLILMIYYCFAQYLVTGPFQDNNSDDRTNCKESWWVNMLYINNVYKTDKICMVWSTFLADVMQFHVIAPIVLIPFAYLKWIGVLFALPFVFAHIITTAIQEHRLSGSIVNPGIFGGDTDTWFYQIYIKPWTRVGPYAIGLILGYILITHKNKAININSKKFQALLVSYWLRVVSMCSLYKTAIIAGWAFAIGIILTTTFVTYSNYHSGTPTWNLLDYTIFQAFFRIAWSLGVAWVIFACATGHGDVVNAFLTWKAWKPLSNITFAAYLIHPLVQAHTMYNMRVKIYYNERTVFFNFMALASTTYLISLAISVILEAPFRSLERAIIRKRKIQ